MLKLCVAKEELVTAWDPRPYRPGRGTDSSRLEASWHELRMVSPNLSRISESPLSR